MSFKNIAGKFEVELVDHNNTSRTYQVQNSTTPEVVATGVFSPNLVGTWNFTPEFFEHHGPSDTGEFIHLMRMAYRKAQDHFDPILR